VYIRAIGGHFMCGLLWRHTHAHATAAAAAAAAVDAAKAAAAKAAKAQEFVQLDGGTPKLVCNCRFA
jgi:ribosomal protein L12E/L44/L45/RPP1/RPP2